MYLRLGDPQNGFDFPRGFPVNQTTSGYPQERHPNLEKWPLDELPRSRGNFHRRLRQQGLDSAAEKSWFKFASDPLSGLAEEKKRSDRPGSSKHRTLSLRCLFNVRVQLEARGLTEPRTLNRLASDVLQIRGITLIPPRSPQLQVRHETLLVFKGWVPWLSRFSWVTRKIDGSCQV